MPGLPYRMSGILNRFLMKNYSLRQIATNPQSVILDSFAGSGTTAHATLLANRKDGGNRKFIVVECEDYADTITAERLRRVINGYSFKGKKREELFRERITWTKFRRSSEMLQQINFIESTDSKRFDSIRKIIKNGELIVVGEKEILENAEGLGGKFTYCTLGKPIDFDSMLTGESLPSFETLGAALFHTSTNQRLDASRMNVNPLKFEGVGYLGASESMHVWLIYKPDLEFLKSRDAALTFAKAEAIAQKNADRRNLVFAPARFVSQKMLNEARIPVEFAPLPFALYRIERGSQS